MAEYNYWATTESGDTVSGSLSAPTPDAAAHLLTLRGWVVQRLEQTLSHPSAVAATRLSDSDFSEAGEKDSRVLVPLLADLQALLEETGPGRTRRALRAAITALEQGQTVEASLQHLANAMPRRFASLIETGLRTGRLPYLMHHALEHLRQTSELRRRLWLALFYPLLLIGVAGVVLGGLMVGIIPYFKRIFDDFGTDLPELTKVIVQISDLLVNVFSLVIPAGTWFFPFFAVFLGTVIFVALPLALLSTQIPEIVYVRQRTVRWIPVLGPLMYAASLSGWFRLLATLTELRLPLPDALRIAGAANGDLVLDAGVKRILSNLEQGDSPLAAAEHAETLPREVLPLFRWARQRDLFVDGLRGAADLYAARARLQSGLVTVLLEPILIFGLGLVVGITVLAAFLPLIKLLNDLA